MSEANYNSYYLRDIELAVLLASKGMTGFYGFKIEDVEELSEEEAHTIIFSLIGKGILVMKDEKFAISEAFEKIVDTIQVADKVLFTSYSEPYVAEQNVYFGKDVVIIQNSGSRGDMLRIVQCPKEEYAAVLTDQGLLIPTNVEEVQDSPYESDKFDYLNDMMTHLFESREDIYGKSDIFASVEYVDISSSNLERLIVLVSENAENLICDYTPERLNIYKYSQSVLERILTDV